MRCSTRGAAFHDRVRVPAQDRLPASPSARSKILRAVVGARMGEAQELHCDGPAIVFGGPYGNLEATRALLDEAARLGIPPARIVCTGDVVAYGADPAATVDLLRAARAWMAQLPRRIDLMIAGARLAVVHGGIARINRFIFASTAPTIKAEELARAGADGVIAGHCGR